MKAIRNLAALTALAALTLVAGAIRSHAQTAQDKWTVYNSEPAAHYRILFPALPTVTKAVEKNKFGVNTDVFDAQAMGTKAVYQVRHMVYPAEFESSVHGAKKGFADGVKGTILSESAIARKGVPGVEAKIRTPAKLIFYIRVYGSDNWGFIIVQGLLEADDTPKLAAARKKFFDSFEIVGR